MDSKPQYLENKGEKALMRFNEFALFRRNLFVLRSSKNLSGEKFAEELGVTKKRVLDFEIGRVPPSFDELRAIAKYFEVTMDDLVYKTAKIVFE